MNPHQHSGVALISAMLVVALATTAAVALTSELQINMRRSANMITRDQAWQYLLGGEEFVKTLIKLAIDKGKLDELLGEERVLPVEGGTITGIVTDLQAHLNINGLIAKKNIDTVIQAWLQNLMNQLEIEPARLDAIIDWMDENDELFSNNGAEDNYYFGLENPYRTANHPFESPSELGLIRDMTAEDVEKLLPEITALPSNIKKINVNTASDLMLTTIGVENLDAVKENRPFKKLSDFTALLQTNDQFKNAKDYLDIQTEYFLLKSTAKIGRARLRSYSIIHRDGKGMMRVISRSLGTL
jgi:general secretion pathway protein K